MLQQIGESVGVRASDEVASKLAEDTDFRLREVLQVAPATLPSYPSAVARTVAPAAYCASREPSRNVGSGVLCHL